jgi:hypothetical protein
LVGLWGDEDCSLRLYKGSIEISGSSKRWKLTIEFLDDKLRDLFGAVEIFELVFSVIPERDLVRKRVKNQVSCRSR